MALSTNDKITVWAIIVAILVGISAFFIPEVRQSLGLGNSNKSIEKVQTQPLNLTNQNSSNSNASNVNVESFSQLQQTSAQEIVGLDVVATGFDVVVNASNTVITIPFKLKDEDASAGTLYSANGSYLADPDGRLYNLIEEKEKIKDSTIVRTNDEGRTIRQHETYRHRLIFQKLEQKPSFVYFHYYGDNKFPAIKIVLNWIN